MVPLKKEDEEKEEVEKEEEEEEKKVEEEEKEEEQSTSLYHIILCYLRSLLLLHNSCRIYIPATKEHGIKPTCRDLAVWSASVQEPSA